MLLYLSASILIQCTEKNPERIEGTVGIKSQNVMKNFFSESGLGKLGVFWEML